jgi:hypothetical protein
MSRSMSEIANFRKQIALQEQAAHNGLYAPAIVASHATINARMQCGAERILKLIEEGNHKEAIALMETETWGAEGE